MVIFRRAPVVSPKKLEASSVALHSTSAKGMMAKQLRTKIAESPQPNSGARIPMGTNTRSRLFQFRASHMPAEKSAFVVFVARSLLKIGVIKDV
jgi:hypothetical protein